MATLTKYPTANTPTTSFNGVANNPTDAYTDNATYANFQPSKPRNDEDAHSWRGFDFSAIPVGSTINSVTVKVQEYMSASNSSGEWRVALFEDVTSAGALAPGVTTAIGGVQYTRNTTDTSEFEWDLGTLSTEPTLAQLQATNFGVRIEAAHGNTATSYTYYVDTIEITVDYTAPVTTPTIEQKAFRFRDDSVALNTDTWTYALNNPLTGVNAIDLDSGDVILRLRVLLENDSATTAMPSTGDWQLQYRITGDATWYALDAGTGVGTATTSNYANGDATTQLLGSGSFATGSGLEESAEAMNRACATSTEIEHEWALTLTASELNNDDEIDFRVVWRQDVEAWNAPDTVTQTPSIAVTKTEGLAQQAYRIRSDATVALNATTGWAAAENTAANINIEEPFRVRFSIEEIGSVTGAKALKFQFRYHNGTLWSSWADLVFHNADAESGPNRNVRAVELVATSGFTDWSDTTYANSAYAHDAATTKQLAYTGQGTFLSGYGIEGANDTPSKDYDDNYSEHEILCIIHRFYSSTDDGTDINEVEVSDQFEFRIVESDDTVLAYNETPSVTVTDADGFIGGTYPESPHRAIVADVNGNLYTLIETMEKQALPVMMKSTDDGVSWVAMDVSNAPGTADLEGFDLVIDNVADVIHILSQGNDLRYLQFYTSAHASADTWNSTVGNELVDASGTADEQGCVLIHRWDTGDLVALYSRGAGTAQRIYHSTRNSDAGQSDTWGTPATVDDNSLAQYGVSAVLGENDDIHLFIVEDTTTVLNVLYWVMDPSNTFAGGTTPITGLDDGGLVEVPIGAPIKYMDGTKEVVMLPYSDSATVGYPGPLATMSFWRTSPGSQAYGTAQTKQAVSTLYGYVGGNNSRMPVFFLANRGTDVWMHWVEDDDADNWDTLYRTLNEDEGGWGTDTSVRTLDANRRAFTMIRGVVYDDGTDDVIGWVIDNAWARDGGTGGLEYGSYTLPESALTISPTLHQQLVTVYGPEVIRDQFITTTLYQQLAQAYDPTVIRDQFITTALYQQLITAHDPTFARFITTAIHQQLAAAYDPIVAREEFITPSLYQQLMMAYDPNVAKEQFITLALIQQLTQAYDPILVWEEFITPALEQQLATAYDPTVIRKEFITPSLIQQLLQVYDLTVLGGQAISLTLYQQLSTAYDPTIVWEEFITPALVQQIATAYDPASLNRTLGVDLLQQLTQAYDPQINMRVHPSLFDQSMVAYDPVTLQVSITPALHQQLATVHDPSLGLIIALSLYQQLAAAHDLDVLGTQPLNPDLLQSLITAYDIAVETGIAPALVQQLITAHDPTLTYTYDITPALVQELAAAFDPTLSPGVVVIDPALHDQSAAAFDPTITSSVSVVVDLVNNTAVVYDPVLDQTIPEQYIIPGLEQQLVAVYDPVVQGDTAYIVLTTVSQLAAVFTMTVDGGEGEGDMMMMQDRSQ